MLIIRMLSPELLASLVAGDKTEPDSLAPNSLAPDDAAGIEAGPASEVVRLDDYRSER